MEINTKGQSGVALGLQALWRSRAWNSVEVIRSIISQSLVDLPTMAQEPVRATHRLTDGIRPQMCSPDSVIWGAICAAFPLITRRAEKRGVSL
jgi:hypothetical protein